MYLRKTCSVANFFTGKSVFITGGTGYVGKVLAEKLLYSCPQVENVYLLIRDLKNQNAEQRLKIMIDSPVFSRLKAEKPDVLKKLVPVKGELTATKLDLSDKDYQTLQNNVSIVIHSAATVKLTESLKTSMAINYEGTKNVLALAKNLKHCDAFVYISTAYAACNWSVVEEKIYPTTTVDEAYQLVEKEARKEDITAFFKGLPNNYTYTKALAENLVADSNGELPAVIVRPSIVVPAVSEPMPGWVDNWFGATFLFHSAALGIYRACYAEYNNNLDLIPVDYVSNLILVAASKADRSGEVSIYNACSGDTNPISIGDACTYYRNAGRKQGIKTLLPFPNWFMFSKRRWFIDMVFNLMYFLAYGAEITLQASKDTPKYRKYIVETIKSDKAISFFSGNSWLMKTPNALDLALSLSAEDLQEFPCNPHDIKWEKYFKTYYRGVKQYLIR